MTRVEEHTPNAQPPGQLTAMMQAARRAGPRVLRVGIVRNKKVIDERLFRRRQNVTIGPNEHNLLVIPVKSMPARWTLFERVGEEYRLNFLDSMRGRLILPSGSFELEELRAQAFSCAPGEYQLPLPETSRGKLVIGDVGVLFQFVDVPPSAGRVALPLEAVREEWIDWQTTIIAAFAFLLHFLAIGAMYSDWLDPVVDHDIDVAGVVDQIKNLPPPPPVEEQPEPTDEETPTAKPKTQKVAKARSTRSRAASANAGSQKAAVAEQAMKSIERELLATLTALSDEGSAIADLPLSSNTDFSLLNEAAQRETLGGGSSLDLQIGSVGGAIRPGSTGQDFTTLGTKTQTQGTEGTGKAKAIKGPKGSAAVGSAKVPVGSVSNASRVVAGMRAGFRACYQRSLAENPDAQGSIHLTLRVGPGGEVQGVTASTTGSLPASVVACVKARASAGQFAPPDGGSAIVKVPVTFVKQ